MPTPVGKVLDIAHFAASDRRFGEAEQLETEFVGREPHDPVARGEAQRFVAHKPPGGVALPNLELRLYERHHEPAGSKHLHDRRQYEPERYERSLTYVQVPVFARLGWGRERRGLQFYFQVGPQVGFLTSEKTEMNFELANRNSADRASQVIAQDTMAVENNIDYGITGGVGMEYTHPKVGHFLLEGRYYYGLGNLYGNSKRDYFAISNLQGFVIKVSYLFDIMRTKNPKIK